MQFRDVIGQEKIKHTLIHTVKDNRVSHAQLLLSPEGAGGLPLALAFAQYLLCENQGAEDSCGECSSCIKSSKLIHPDIHYSYPVISKKAGQPPKSTDYIVEWREAVNENPYMKTAEWLQFIEAENKQGNITTEECHDIIRKLSMKSFESSYKVLILWMPEYLKDTGNILLKSIEEPPANTIFLLVAEHHEHILPTILSRTQLIKLSKLTTAEIVNALVSLHDITESDALEAALVSEGDYAVALKNIREGHVNHASLFTSWLEHCLNNNSGELFFATAKFATLGREVQKNFFMYALHFIRETVLSKLYTGRHNILTENEMALAERIGKVLDFEQLEQFTSLINTAHYHIERNANPRILFFNLSLNLTKVFKKEQILSTNKI